MSLSFFGVICSNNNEKCSPVHCDLQWQVKNNLCCCLGMRMCWSFAPKWEKCFDIVIDLNSFKKKHHLENGAVNLINEFNFMRLNYNVFESNPALKSLNIVTSSVMSLCFCRWTSVKLHLLQFVSQLRNLTPQWIVLCSKMEGFQKQQPF